MSRPANDDRRRETMMTLTVRIRKHERGLWFRDGEFFRLLGPGTYRFWNWLWGSKRDDVQVVNTLDVSLSHPLLNTLATYEEIRRELEVVDLAETERALVWKNGHLIRILGPGLKAYWRQPHDIRVERFNVESFRFEHPHMDAILTHVEAPKWLESIRVAAWETVLLFRDGRFVEKLGEGRYVFWQKTGTITSKTVDLREQLVDVSGQEILTADKVTIRANVLVTYQVVDPFKAVTTVIDYAQAIYRESQLAIRAAVGSRSLEALLAAREAIGQEVYDALAARLARFGVNLGSVGLRDIILPGEMRSILNQVIVAEKEAEANVIKRREETAATRSLANTARLLADNPVLARMKELETLQQILAGMNATFVFGNNDIIKQVSGLVASKPDEKKGSCGGQNPTAGYEL